MRPLAIPYPNIDPVALDLGPIAIKWYGLAYVAGLLLGLHYVKRLLGEDRLWAGAKSPAPPALGDDIFIWVTLGVVIGGRLGHILLYEPVHYFTQPLEILKVWHGGMAFHGGVAGVIVAMLLFARRHALPALLPLDLVAAAVPFGLFFGRVANFINSEVVGTVTTMPWGIVFPGWGNFPRHPAQLYEAVLEGIVLFVILRRLTHTKLALARTGFVGGAFLAGYGALRMVCELFKHDEHPLFAGLPITAGFFYCIPMVIAGVVLMRRARPAPIAA